MIVSSRRPRASGTFLRIVAAAPLECALCGRREEDSAYGRDGYADEDGEDVCHECVLDRDASSASD